MHTRETEVEQYRGTTICSVRRGNLVVMGGDGQVTLGNTVMKANARKVRRLYKDKVIAGFEVYADLTTTETGETFGPPGPLRR